MSITNSIRSACLFRTALVITFIAATLLCKSNVAATPGQEQRGFTSPSNALNALKSAIKSDSSEEVLSILGAGSIDLIYTGDTVADKKNREVFLKHVNESTKFNQLDQDHVNLSIGKKNLSFPFTITRINNHWFFEKNSDFENFLNMRIIQNERIAVEFVNNYISAQYFYRDIFNKTEGIFAQKIASSKGRKDGLYWATKEGEQSSPLGNLFDSAIRQGYSAPFSGDPPSPFQGYTFKILRGQGEHADGGAMDYIVDNKMVLGFALIAYPAKYAVTGFMTFIVNHDGIIYEKDLGEDTASKAASATVFDPDPTWRRLPDPQIKSSR